MILTILEARVERQNWSSLEQAYHRGIQHHGRGLVQTFLVQSRGDPEIWRIMTVWESQGALDEMRASEETPRGVLMFREAQAEPLLSVYDIAQQMTAVWPS